jgi:oligopeptide/dipeptide ABC transporter ATP-binding protein
VTRASPATAAVGEAPQGRDYVISVRRLRMYFPIKEGILQRVTGHVRAVDDVSFDVHRGETVGLVGESGCGKTTLGRCISGLSLPTEGGVYFGLSQEAQQRLDALLSIDEPSLTGAQRKELAQLTADHRIDAMPRVRWRNYRRNCQVVFQDAFSSLNPRQLVKDVVGRPLRIYEEASGTALIQRVIELLESVGLGRQHLYRYPHQFSGGQRQRISIARALALEPEFIVLDEPTSALDVSVQAQILNLLHQLQQAHGLTYLFISHDLNVVRHMSDRIIVMYLGQVSEVGSAEQLFGDPRHPYTEALLAADPSLDEEGRDIIRLSGAVPDPSNPPQGCRFHTRCPAVTPICGWEVDDVLTELERRGGLLDRVSAVRRESPFAAEISFEDPEAAAEANRELTLAPTPEPLRAALTEVRVGGTTLHVRLEPVEEVRLEVVDLDHSTACVLHTSRGDRALHGHRPGSRGAAPS